MGGSLPTGTGIPALDKALDAVTLPLFGGTAAASAVTRTLNDPGGARNAASNAATAQSQALSNQQAASAQLQTTLLTQPKQISPDNFLANKASQLANLRLGLASTITGPGNAPSPVVSAPSLTGNYTGKVKLGQ